MASHVKAVMSSAALHEASAPAEVLRAPTFSEVYDEHFAFVWRTARRLGVLEEAVDDVVQDVFLVVYRRLDTFEGRSSLKTWLFGITRRVVSDHRRARSRRQPHTAISDSLSAPGGSPHDVAARLQAAGFLYEFLDRLPEEQREVFVLAELEQMTVPEIAEATGTKLNTVYSRLRLARKSFERAVERYRARESGRSG